MLTRLVLEGLEDRTLLDAAPAPLIQLQQTIAASFSSTNPLFLQNFNSPAIAVDPTDPSKMAAVFIEHIVTTLSDTSDALVFFSTDGGASWGFGASIFPDINPGTSPNFVPFPYISDPSIAFDPNHQFYVLLSQHTAAIPYTDGELTLNKFDFSGSTPIDASGGLNTKVYSWDFGIQPGYNPALAVDSSAPVYADPQSGATQTDPASGYVYVGWNIDVTPPPPPFPPGTFSNVVMRVSVDGGREFGGLVSITQGLVSTSGPALAIAQGTNSGAANPITGGSVNVLFSQYDPFTPIPPNASSILNQRFPRTPSSYITHGGSIGTAVTQTGTLVQFTNTINGLVDTSGLGVGDPVLGAVNVTGTLTAGSNLVTGVSNFAGLVFGAIVTGASIPSTPPTTITALNPGAGTITLSQNATTTGVQTLTIQSTLGAIPAGTIITQINGMNSITVSNAVTGSGTEPLIFVIPGISAGTITLNGVVGAILNGTLMAGAPIVTGLSSTAGLVVGETVAGTGVPGGTGILSIDSATQITLSANATNAGTFSLTFGDGPAAITFLSSTAGLAVGNAVTGAGIPAGTTIAAIVSAFEVLLTQNGTVPGPEPITFSLVQRIVDAGIGNGTINVPITTNFTTLVNINPATAPAFTTVSDLSVSLKLIHPHLESLSIVLFAPDGTQFTLLQNNVNADGTVNMGIGLTAGVNLGVLNGIDGETIFDDGAARLLTNPANVDPHLGFNVPNYQFGELTFSQALDGQLPSSPNINGTWTLAFTDFRNDGATIPTQFVSDWSLDFTSNLDTSLTSPAFSPAGVVGGALPSNATAAPFPFTPPVAPNTGIGPGLAVAQDNTLGGFSPFQGRIYLAYVKLVSRTDINGVTAILDNGNIQLIVSDDGGSSWHNPDPNDLSSSKVVNDDSAFDGFSEGRRTQFLPQITVDPGTGSLVVSYYDAREDASNARVATSLTVSIDGGQTFSPWTPANRKQTATSAITGQTVDQEPLPDNQSAGNPNTDTLFSFGSRQGLVAVNGHLVAIWAGNQNLLGTAANPKTLDIYETTASYVDGPRIISSTQGPVAGSSLNNTFTADGQQLADRFEVLFDRVVDPDSFKPEDVAVIFRSPTMPLTVAGIPLTVLSVTAEDFGPHGPAGALGATRFLIRFDPTDALAVGGTYTGTYSYAVGPLINDRIRSAPDGIGNVMDENANGTPGQANVDQFSAPGTVNGVPFQIPYDTSTLPLIVSGPHVISTIVQGNPPTGDDLVLNGTTNAINVVFDRDIDPTSFTSAQVLRMIGPIGPISGALTVTANPAGTPVALAKRSFKIGFPTQTLSGTYSIVLASTIKALNNGDLLDTNLNAGLDLLRGGSTIEGTNVPVTFTDTGLPLSIGPNRTVTATLDIDNPFLIQGITTKLSISALNDPDLEAVLVHPDGTQIKLFTNVGNTGPSPHSDFTNTVFDDFAPTPIQQGVPPFNIGSFNPQIPLSRLKGKSSAGTWKLIIKNDGTNTNTLTDWSLTLLQNIPGTDLGQPVADQATVHFRIFTQAPDNPQSQNTWSALGGAANNNGANSGRIGGLAIDPSDPSGNTLFVAGASGGVWKTTNFLTNDPRGPTYVPLLDFGQTFGINIGGIAVFGRNQDPRQSVVIVGTGEGDTGSRGVGFIISKDGGNTWNVFDSTTNVDSSGNPLPIGSSLRNRVFVGASVFKILVDPKPAVTGEVIIYATVVGGSAQGLYRSLDTGKHWTLMRAGNVTDIAFANSSASGSGKNIQVLFAGFRGEGVFESPNQGNSWIPLLGDVGDPLIRDFDFVIPPALTVAAPQGLPTGAKGRIVLATPALTGNPVEDIIYQGFLYAGVVTTGGRLDGLYMTKDFGQNWAQIQLPVFLPTAPNGAILGAFPSNDNLAPTYDPLGNGRVAQGNYDVSLAVDPTNPNVVYLGGTADFQPNPAGGLLRIDTALIRDAHNLSAFNSHRNDGGLPKPNTLGAINLKNTNAFFGLIVPFEPGNFLDLIRDPDNPFLANNTLFTTNITGFNNDGFDVRWMGFNAVVSGSTDQHRVVTMIDPLTGHARLIFGDDQGVFSGIDRGDGTLIRGIGRGSLGTGIDVFATGSRNGNLQITQNYYGAGQPSILAAQIAGALFYGSTQDNGFPQSATQTLQNGNIVWTGSTGDGTGVATDQTGSGTLYNYMWPCCGVLTETDFFVVTPPGGAPVGRTFGLLQAGDDPGNNVGQWKFTGGSNFAVNSINGDGIVMSSSVGRIFRTQDQGRNWFVIGNPTDLDSTYAAGVAFGAPHTSDLGNLNNFIYAGTTGGRIFVTSQGGGTGTSSTWINISAGLDGSAVQQIVTNPKRDTNEAYAVTLNGVYHMVDSLAAGATWVNITGNLFSITHAPFGNSIYTETILKYLTTIQADWRFATPTAPPILYVGGEGGVFRSTNMGGSWSYFPDVANQGAPVDGGYLPNAHVTDLDLVTGDIDPATGLPKDASTGLNMLVASTYGRGSFGIRLALPLPSTAAISTGPVVSSVLDASNSASEALTVTFGKTVSSVFVGTAVDPSSFSPSDIVLKDPTGTIITVQQVIDIAPGGIGDIHNVYRLIFNSSASGNYTITIGPKVTDFSGDKMAAAFTSTVAINPLARPTVSLPYFDSFTGNFGDPLPRQWLNGPGYFNIQLSPTLVPSVIPVESFAVGKAVGTNIAVLQNLDPLQAAAFVQADVNVTSVAGSNAGLLARYKDGNNFYLGELRNVNGSYFATIVKNSGGTMTTLANFSASSAFGSLRFEVVDSSLKLFLNGSLVAYADDISITAAGTIGIDGTQGTTFDNFTSGTITLQNATLPFSDDFGNTSFGSQLDRRWLDRAGNITVVNGQATGEAAINLSTVNGINQKDVAVTASIALTGSQFASLVTRYGGPLDNNWYLGQLTGNGNGTFTATISKKVNGVQTLLATGLTVSSASGTLEFESVGPSLKLILNGSLVAFADDLSLTTGTVGMRIGQNVTIDNFAANAVVPLNGTLPFNDDFSTTSDGSQLDRQWTDQTGNITVVGGVATGVGSGANLSTVNGISQGDVAVIANVTVASGQYAGLVARYSGPLESNMYAGFLSSVAGGFQGAVWKNIGGTWTRLMAGTTVASGSGTLEFEAVGASLKLIFNGQLLAFAQDSSITTAGSVGMRISKNATVDVFGADQVVPLPGSFPPFSDDFSTTSDGSQLDRQWTDQNGNITVVGGLATGVGATNLSTVNGISQGDVAVTATVSVASGQYAGLVARYSGPLESNMYAGFLSSVAGGFQGAVWKNNGGTWTQLMAGTTVASGSGTLEFEAVGASLKLIFNGQLLAFAEDTSITTAGSVGMRISKNATVDVLQADEVVTQTGSLPFSDDFTTTSDGSQLDRQWSDQNGNISVVGGLATGVGSGANLSTVNGIGQGDVAVTATINVAGGQYAGLVARYSGPLESNMYAGFLSSVAGGFQGAVWKNNGGTWTQLMAGTTVASGSGTLEFEAVGASLKLIFNGQLLAFAEDTSIATAGSVGMRISKNATVSLFGADEVVTQTVTVPPAFSDDFSTTSDGSQLDRQWTDQNGNISVVGGLATGVGSGANLSTVNGISQGDVAVTATVNVASDQYAGLVARYSGPLESNMYAGFLSSVAGGFQGAIWKNNGGTWTQLTAGTTVASGSGSLEFETVGASLKLIFNGQLLAFAQDTSITAAGSVGMRISKNATVSLFGADQVVPQTGSFPFSADFSTTSDGSQLDRQWTDQNGNITVVGGLATGVGATNLSTVNGINAADETVQATIALNGAVFAGLVARYSGPLESNMYAGFLVSVSGGFQVSVWKNKGGTWTQLAVSATFSGTGAGTLKFEAIGTSLKVSFNNTQFASAIDSDLTSGSVGMRIGKNATVDDFTAN